MIRSSRENHLLFLLVVGILSWLIPGAGYLFIGENRRGIIIFATIVVLFCTGLYVGSIGVVDPVEARLWYAAQIMTSPLAAVVGYITAGGGYPVYGKPAEIGQIYTSVAGLLNLLCIVNAVYLAHRLGTETAGKVS